MTITYNSDGSLYADGIFSASDYNAIASFYNNLLGVNIGSLGSGHVLTHDDLNAIRNAVLSMSGDYNIPGNFPGQFSNGQIWPKLTWSPTSYKYREWTYTGNGEFWVPAGVHGINVVMIVAGGGGGGFGTNQNYGGSGGSGGAGGWYQNYHLGVNPGDHVQIYIGAAGVGSYRLSEQEMESTGNNGPYSLSCSDSTSGGDTFITVNGNEVLRVTGGGKGVVAAPDGEGGQGGYGGSPNGSAGGQGAQGSSHHSGHGTYAGPSGASSPWGQGGQGGASSGQNSNPAINAGSASGYGAGGGGGGTCANTGYYYTWTGGNGSPGKCVIGLPG